MTQETAVARRARARSRAWALMAWAAVAATGAARAQTPPAPPPPVPQANAPMPAAAPAPKFAIRGFNVTGDNPLGDGETARILAPFLRADGNMDTLQEATAALEKALRERGYGLHRVALPPQEVGDTVKLEIVTFTISRVAIDRGEGNTPIYDDDNIRRTLPELQVGKTPNFKKLAIQTAIANENPNKQVQLGIREADEPDKIDSTISVKELKPWTFSASLSNAGSKTSGRDRLTVSGGHSNLFNRDHQFVAAYTTSIEATSDVKQIGLSYKAPLYDLGGVVGASFTKSDVVGNFGTFTSTGAGQTAGLSYTHYLHPEGGRRSYVTVGVDDKLFNRSKINNEVVPGTMDRRSRPLTLGYTARIEGDNASWGYNVDFAANLGGGNGNDVTSYRTEDTRITTTRWKALRGGINYAAPIANDWSWSARGQFQYSPDSLIAGEQFGLGGIGSVRGTATDRPVSGDSGLSFTFELTTPEFLPGLRAVGFLDGGYISNNDVIVSADPTVATSLSKPSSDHLTSVGLGLRYFLGTAFSVTADYGRLLNTSKIPLSANSSAPQRGDHRFYVSVSYRF